MTPPFFMEKEQELQNLLSVYMKRLQDEISRSVAYEARINVMAQQIENALFTINDFSKL